LDGVGMQKKELIDAAKDVRGQMQLGGEHFSAGCVAAALRTEAGNIYTGICIDLACGIGFCAEHAAIAEMLKNRETKIDMIVAVSADSIIPPCGRCREMMAQVDEGNLGTQVILSGDRTVPLTELLPHRWY